MVRHALTLASITLLASAGGCHAASAPRAALRDAPANVAKKSATKKASTKPTPLVLEETPDTEETAPTATRKLGDFHVYQYGGSFSKEPVTLTEQVVAREEGDVLVVDFVLEEGSLMSALRVRMRPDEEILRVSRITVDGESDATVADYDALMKKTAFVPDSNDEVLGTEHTSCLVGTEQVDCDVTTYGVTVGRKQAKLSITRSAKIPGRDIGGDVVSSDGKVLYSARLVERGNEPPVAEALAKMDTRFVPEGP